MRILELQIKNFGKFANKTLRFHQGMNIMTGANEVGKTTIVSFICGMLYGIEKQRGRATGRDEYSLRQPWENPVYFAGVMRFESGGKIFRLERSFHTGEKRASLVCETDGEELSIDHGDLAVLLEGMSETAFRNTIYITQGTSEAKAGLADEVRRYMTNLQSAGDSEIDVKGALAKLEEQRKVLEGEQKQALMQANEKCREIRMKLDYVQQELVSLQGAALEKEAEMRRAQEEWQEALHWQETMKVQAKEPERRDGKRKRAFLLPLLGLLAVLTSALVPGIWPKGLALAGGLVLFGSFWWRRKHSLENKDKTETESHEEQQRQQGAQRIQALGQERQRLKWQLEHFREEIREKETARDNLMETIEEIGKESYKQGYLQEEVEAVKLAISSIKEVSKELHQRLANELNQRVSEILSVITEGRYTSIFLNEALRIRINTPGKLLTIEQVSRGTMDQIYFALRMAAGELLSQEESMPIILDDAFVMYDDKRLRETIRWLIDTGRQVLLFTCHGREQKIYEDIMGMEEK